MAKKFNKAMYFLDQKDMPTHWYNVQPDLPEPLPPTLNPMTKQPATPEFMHALFPMECIMQEVNTTDRYIEIPDEVLEIYRTWRPTVLHRAYRLEKALDTPAKIFYKYEGTNQAGSHKPNTAVAQAYYNKQEGIKRIATETGAGQWGSALAFAGTLFDIEIKVYMVRISYDQKPYRRIAMEVWGANCVPSPSPDTKVGRDMLAKWPDCPGSLGLAISEAVEDAVSREDTHYSLGSVVNHVLLHQTIIGEETRKQMEMADAYPDIIVGCIGGGSNFAGQFLPWIRDKLSGKKKDLRIICVEPESCPTVTKGLYAFDYGDAVGLGPIVKMYTLGHGFIPPPIHAGGLRYHGMAPIICHLHRLGFVEAQAVPQTKVFEAGVQFARTEGIISAPEANHDLKVAIDEALKCREEGKSKTILIAHSGHGHFDLSSYEKYLSGELVDYAYPEEEVRKAQAELPQVSL
ncbi:MAG: TrpB-like pyridoxal phosphate-dependent enzyme [Deltaproteobacteria bacterium]|nr:TrpB-like pyridoxal phosphate-dependent enzyme [Deltaproteobacteria bacterium]